jgi:acyl carrier protein
VESWSRPAGDLTAEPVLHASARIAHGGGPPAGRALSALRASLTERLDDDDESSLFRLGPHWDNVAGSWARPGRDTSEVLLQLRLPADYRAEVEEHMAHPALLDSATTGFRRPEDGFHLPFCCPSFTFYDSMPAELFVHLRRGRDGAGVIRADLDIIAPDGRLLAQASGYTLRKIDAQRLRIRPELMPSSAPDGIATADGVALTLSLLTARHPGQVLVEPRARPLNAAGMRAPGKMRQYPHGYSPDHPAAADRDKPPQLAEAKPVRVPPAADDTSGNAGGANSGQFRPPLPAADVEGRVRALWIDAMGDSEVAADTDFFAVGGNSLTAVTLISDLREAFGVDLPISAIFDSPTIGSLAAAISAHLDRQAAPA